MRKRFANRAISLLLTIVMLVSMVPAAFSAESYADSFTNPFTKGALNSTSWRIPAMVTLNNGTIVAAADARWNTTYDGGGLDTAVAYSTDNGATWTKSLENYLGDNGDVYNGGSTCFIDPALATNGSIVWMLCDLYPFGIALNGGKEDTPYSGSTGFNSDGYLLLAKSSSRTTDTSSYTYYLKNGEIYSSSGTAVSGLTVDADFNVTGTYNGSTVNSNLFFKDSPFKVYPTGYLYLKSSTDYGKTWSKPTLLNLKTSSEQVCLVGPGRGLVTSTGRIVFPVYSYTSSAEYLSFVYSDDNGASWHRSSSFTSLDSSEAAVVELTDGTLRFFFRNHTGCLCYADAAKGATTFSGHKQTDIPVNSNTQLSAITYSKTIGGDQVILLSCPTGPNGGGSNDSDGSCRTSGKIHVLTVDADNENALTLKNTVNVTAVATGQLSGSNYTESNGFFAYSCLTEMGDGSVALLYENNQYGWGAASDGSNYYTINGKAFTESELETTTVTFDEETVVDAFFTQDGTTAITGLTMTADSAAQTVKLAKVDTATQSVAVSSSNEGVATVSVVSVNELVITPVAAGSTTITATVSNNTRAATAKEYTLSVTVNAADTDEGGDGEITVTGEDKINQSGGGTVTTYEKDEDGVNDGAQYLIVYNGNALTYDGSRFSSTAVEENNDGTLTVTTDISNAVWVYQNKGFYNNAQGKYLNISSSGLQTTTDTTVTGVSGYNNGYLLYRNRYLRFESSSWSTTSKQNKATRVELYKVTEGTSATYTVDAALQENRIAALTVTNAGYTDDSWNAYQAALTAAKNKLTEVEEENFTSEAEAEAALNELIAAVDALKTAKNALEKAITITVNYICNGKTVFSHTAGVVESDTSYAIPYTTVTGADGTVYSVGTTSLNLTGAATYNVPVTKLDAIPVTVTEGSALNIDLANSADDGGYGITLSDGQYVEWTTSDGSYVGVAGVYDSTAGAYTDAAIIAGQNVTTSPVLVTGTVYNENGTVAGVYKWLVTVTENTASSDMRTVTIKFDIAYLRNCTVYYSINAGPLTEIKLADLYTTTDSDGNTYYYFDAVVSGSYTNSGHGVNVSFFAKPDEGYALTYMAYTSSQALTYDYYTISDGNPDGSGSEAWPFDDEHQSTVPTSQADAAWKNNSSGNCTGYGWALLQGNMTLDQWKLMMSNAIALGCDGVQLFTKNNANETFEADLYFVSQKLPEMTKEVTFVGGEPYNPDAGTKVEIGDTIVYKITVYEPVADENYGTITYSDINIQDPLTGDSWTTKGTAGTETTVTINGHTFTAIPYTYTTSLTLTTQNFTDVVNAGTITNTVTFSYLANSTYSSGSVSVAAQAGIHVSVDPSYVVDFGVPLNIDLSELVDAYGLISKIEDPAGNEVSISNNKLHINTTDARSFTDIMAYKVTLTDNGAYYITIIPASNVLFEAETFMTARGSGAAWTTTGSATVTEQDGSETDPYGYDGKYAEQAAGAYSAGLACTASVSSSVRTTQDLTFSFTGTGFDLIGTCGPNTGTLLVRVDNKNGLYMSYMVDTSFEDDNYGTIYQVPLIHAQDWPEGTYTVTIRGVYMGSNADFGIDAFRVYRSTAEQAYNDAERNAKYYNVLNETILNGNTIQAYTEKSTGTTTEWEVTEYEANGGPQNEIYLAAGQAVAFKVVNSADVYDTHNPLVHFSARALDDTGVTVTVIGLTTRSGSITSGTEMYYAVTASNDGLITIKNESGGILALGNLKLTAALSNGEDDEGNETDFGTKVTSGTENTNTVSTFSLRSRAASVQTCGVINVGQPAILVPVDEEDQKIIEDMLDGSGEDTGTETPDDSETGTPDDSGNSGSTGSTGNDDVVILPTPDTSVDAEDEPEDETTDGPQSPYLNKGEAYAYITGFADGTVRPMAEITRAEVATIFYRMLKDEIRDRYWSNTNDFTDVTSGDWYNTAVSTLASLGIVTGNPDGSFNPNGKITRAEFATMAVRFFVVTEEYDLDETVFSDISTSWAAKNILLAYELGLVNGNPDGTFRPGNSITRAEAMTIVNNMLGRKPKVAGLPDEADMITWVDNADKSVWYYAGVQAATNSYTSVYSEEIGGDLWTGVTTVPNWSELEKIWAGKHTED